MLRLLKQCDLSLECFCDSGVQVKKRGKKQLDSRDVGAEVLKAAGEVEVGRVGGPANGDGVALARLEDIDAELEETAEQSASMRDKVQISVLYSGLINIRDLWTKHDRR